ncbi:Cof-type HAD-IIB family hydrolase [Halalkalibacter krulwichiae]|uniref:Sugar phosphatase YidA n=1 Tax=Halalkalibacter krulwichiae TaxID=199441 RepID=A0A1X9M824_9BACI|nr:Cof-type HAD-IIB family hydrolase [Halalkalibacter krulwichiae]ARK29578.1 Sugar phosphatase YidA [Halalkalibacter krulwichiae]
MVNNRQIKLIAIDMDGTLLNDCHEISMENRKAIQEAEEKGIHVVISTGRTRMSCDELVNSLALHAHLITVNGSEIWDENRTLIERQLLDLQHIEQMWGLKQQHDATCWAATVNKVIREEFPSDLSSHEWMKFGFDIEEDDTRKKILAELQKNKELEVTNSSPTNIEINAAGVNKANALKKVCERLGITMDHVLAMGDSLNDLAMIKEAGIGVAMGNAQPFVKQSADWITATNVENGVAKAIQRWALRSSSQ